MRAGTSLSQQERARENRLAAAVKNRAIADDMLETSSRADIAQTTARKNRKAEAAAVAERKKRQALLENARREVASNAEELLSLEKELALLQKEILIQARNANGAAAAAKEAVADQNFPEARATVAEGNQG